MLKEYAHEFVEHRDNPRATEKDFYSQMAEGRYPRNELAYRLKDCGYTPALNPKEGRGQWMVKRKRTTVYVHSNLPEEQRLREASALAGFLFSELGAHAA